VEVLCRELLTDLCHFLCILFRQVRFIEDVVLLVRKIHAPEAVFEILGVCAELAVVALVCVHKEVAVVVEWRLHAVTRSFRFKADGDVTAVSVAVDFYVVQAILACECVVALITALALGEVVAGAVFCHELVRCQIGVSGAQFLYALHYKLTVGVILQMKFLHSLPILVLRQLFVEEAVLFLVQSHATKTILTSKAITAKLAGTAVLAVAAVATPVAFRTV